MPADALIQKLHRSGRPSLPGLDAVAATLAREAEDRLRPLAGLPLAAAPAAPRVLRLEAAVAALPGAGLREGLIGLVEAGGAVAAVIAADAALAWHMTDLALGGDPEGAPAPLPRPATAIDLALGRLHLEAIRGALAAALAPALGRPAAGLRLAAVRPDLAELRLGPPQSDALVLGFELALGSAGRRGGCALILTLAALDGLRAAVGAPEAAAEPPPDDLWRGHMRRVAAAAPLPTLAVLHRLSLSLAALEALRPGQVLEIPRASAETIRLCIPQPGGRSAVIATGRLGALDERKVVKLDSAPDPRLIRHLTAALRPGAAAPEAAAEAAAVEPAAAVEG